VRAAPPPTPTLVGVPAPHRRLIESALTGQSRLDKRPFTSNEPLCSAAYHFSGSDFTIFLVSEVAETCAV
jgi:hypothetical protein